MEIEKNDEEIIANEQDENHQSSKQNTCKQDEIRDEVPEDRNKAKGEVEVGEKGFEIESLKKPKQSLKQIPTTKVTVPKPFSLATDKRKIARESRPYGDVVKEKAPTLTRSRSMINHRVLPQVSNGGEKISVLSRSRTLKQTSQASLPPKITARKHSDTIFENGHKVKSTTKGNEIEKKKPQLDSKLGSVVDAKKQTKTNTFKPLSLPSFYHKKDPLPTPETKKIPIKDAKTMLPNKERKSMSITGDKVRVSKSVTSSAKETISKFLKTTQMNLSRSEEIAKVVVVSEA